jgi:peptidoglycan/xylan/chitin deacetylase (PgdA/CDA1 family)
MKIALRIECTTYHGTRQGVPRLADMLDRLEARATFLFTLGPGRSRARLLPRRDIGRTCQTIMRQTGERGFETGVCSFDADSWLRQAASAGAEWTEQALERAMDRYREIFGHLPEVHGAPGWEMNRHALRLLQRWGFAFGSDARGSRPFIPVQDAEIVRCPQLPTTLPTLPELLGGGLAPEDALERLLALTDEAAARPQVFALQAETEGMALAPLLEKLLEGWRRRGRTPCSLGELYRSLDVATLPLHQVVRPRTPGQTHTVLQQGDEFLAPCVAST